MSTSPLPKLYGHSPKASASQSPNLSVHMLATPMTSPLSRSERLALDPAKEEFSLRSTKAPVPGTTPRPGLKLLDRRHHSASAERHVSQGHISPLAHTKYQWHNQNPGPGKYNEQQIQKKRGFSMRPKTAYEKTYFINNQQQRKVPSPFLYDINTSRDGVATVSKFRTVTMGGTLQSKDQRFRDASFVTPSSFVYRPNKHGINKYSRNGKMGMSERKSFIDDATRSEFTPGPGNYRMPTEFSHYSNFKHSRFSVC